MASSPAPNVAPDQLGPLSTTARVLVVGLGWSALMLGVLGFWIRSKYEGRAPFMSILSSGFLIAAVAALGLAVWQGFTLWFKKEGPAEKATTLENQRRLFSLILMAAGLALIGLAFVLGIGKKPAGTYGFLIDNLGESIGSLLFGLIALGSGYLLSQPLNVRAASPVQFLNEKVPVLKMVMAVLSGLALFAVAYLYYDNRTEEKYLALIPELAALLGASILFFACFLWLNSGVLDDFGVRLFVLVLGGSIGLILFLYSLLRVYYWRNDIIFGGLTAWQGENAWRFWTCVYLQFAALVLMFGSFNLARTDIRTNVYLRRVMYGYDTIVQGLLLVEILAVLNVVFYAMVPFTFDWTASRGLYQLADSTQNTISNLQKEVNVVVLMSQNDRSFRDIRNMMDNCSALSSKFKVKFLSPENEPESFNQLATLFPKIRPEGPRETGGKGILIVSGPMPDTEKHNSLSAFIADSKLVEEAPRRSRDDKPKRIFKGEGEIMKEIRFLVQDQKKRKVYFVQGEDVSSINDDSPMRRPHPIVPFTEIGMAQFAEKLRNDNLDVFGLNFGVKLPDEKGPEDRNKGVVFPEEETDKRKSVPKDCDTLIVAGISKPLPPVAIEAIERYMERGGRMLVCLDVVLSTDFKKMQKTGTEPITMVNTGLEPMLKRFGVEVTDSFAVALRAPPDELDHPPSTLVALGAPKSDNPLARQFARRGIYVKNSARVLKVAEMPGPFKAEPVLIFERAGDRATMVESDLSYWRKSLFLYAKQMWETDQYVPKIKYQPPAAVAVTDNVGDKPRMVVVADCEFISNYELQRSNTSATNYAFAFSALEWMAERESIGVRPKETPTFSIDPSVDTTRMVLLPGWLMLLTLTGLGTGIWIVRRR